MNNSLNFNYISKLKYLYIQYVSLLRLTVFPIRTSRKSSNIIDLVICSPDIFSKITEVSVCKSLDISDHWPVSFNCHFEFKT